MALSELPGHSTSPGFTTMGRQGEMGNPSSLSVTWHLDRQNEKNGFFSYSVVVVIVV